MAADGAVVGTVRLDAVAFDAEAICLVICPVEYLQLLVPYKTAHDHSIVCIRVSYAQLIHHLRREVILKENT